MFYLVEISEGADSIKGKAIYEYDNLNSAVAMFHKKLGTAMGSELYTSDLVMVIDGNGAVYKSEKYVAEPKEEPIAE